MWLFIKYKTKHLTHSIRNVSYTQNTTLKLLPEKLKLFRHQGFSKWMWPTFKHFEFDLLSLINRPLECQVYKSPVGSWTCIFQVIHAKRILTTAQMLVKIHQKSKLASWLLTWPFGLQITLTSSKLRIFQVIQRKFYLHINPSKSQSLQAGCLHSHLAFQISPWKVHRQLHVLVYM